MAVNEGYNVAFFGALAYFHNPDKPRPPESRRAAVPRCVAVYRRSRHELTPFSSD